MPFDLAWDFRSVEIDATDPAYAVFANDTHAYPHTYTNVNGDSINAGWVSGDATDFGSLLSDATNDPRIVGYVYKKNNSGPRIFQVDLSSGSAPGAGTYTVDLALGSGDQALLQYGALKDNTTTKIDLTNGGAGFTNATDHYRDATVADVTATSTWSGATASVAFASTTVNLEIGAGALTSYSSLCHFRLTLQAGGAVATRSMLMLMGVGA